MTLPEPLRAATFVEELCSTVPEVAAAVREEAASWQDRAEGPPLHIVVLETLTVPLLDPLLRARARTPEEDWILVRALDLVERMATSEDAYLEDVAVTGVIEWLASLPNRPFVRNLVGPVTRRWLDLQPPPTG